MGVPLPASQVRELDSPSGRAELGRLATMAAREELERGDVEIFWDELWIRRVGDDFFPDPEIWADPAWDKWLGRVAKYERDVHDYWFHIYQQRAGDVIVDIGAGRGEDVFVFSKAVGAEGKVWAIEPHPVSYLALRKLCEWNRLRNVALLNVACTEADAALQIETLPVWESNYIRPGGRTSTSFPVAGVPFDDLRKQNSIGPIDFLKMNIEGAERSALPGALKALRETKFVCVAAHDFRADRGEGDQFRTMGFVREFLSDAGFTVTTRDEDPRYYVPYHVHGSRAALTQLQVLPRAFL